MSDLLEGVRQDDWTGDELPASVTFDLARRGEVVYRVSEKEKKVEAAPSSRGEKRSAARRRTRLRSGKLLDSENRFVSECQIIDQSKDGWRLRLARNLGAPASCRIYDDESGEIAAGRVVWRKDGLVGVRKLRSLAPSDVKATVKTMLGGRYYAVKG
jgi:hypothetical protein